MTISLGEVCYSEGKFSCSEYFALTHHHDVLQDLNCLNCRRAAMGTLGIVTTLVNAARCFSPYRVHAHTARIIPSQSDFQVTCLLLSAHF